jgi:hypothetical protein
MDGVGGEAVKGGDVAIYVRFGLLFQRLGVAPLHVDDEVTKWCGVKVFGAEGALVDVHCIYCPPVRTGVADDRTDGFDVACLPYGPSVLFFVTSTLTTRD